MIGMTEQLLFLFTYMDLKTLLRRPRGVPNIVVVSSVKLRHSCRSRAQCGGARSEILYAPTLWSAVAFQTRPRRVIATIIIGSMDTIHGMLFDADFDVEEGGSGDLLGILGTTTV